MLTQFVFNLNFNNQSVNLRKNTNLTSLIESSGQDLTEVRHLV